MSDDLFVYALNGVGAVAVAILWGFPSIFFHELGHVTMAKLLGMKPAFLVVGVEDELFEFQVFGVLVVIRTIPLGGIAIVESLTKNRLKAFLFVVAGPASNAFVLWLCTRLWSGSSFKVILAAIILAEGLQVLAAILPVDTEFDGVTFASDGKRLFQILLGRYP